VAPLGCSHSISAGHALIRTDVLTLICTARVQGQNYSAGNQHGDGFCLTLTDLTIFAGVAVNMPFCTPDVNAPDGIQRHPKFVSIVLPPWLHVFPTNNRTSTAYYVPHVNRTTTLPDGTTATQ
jgi:hypothetical protein